MTAAPQVAIEFDRDDLVGRALVDAGRRAGGSWVVLRSGADASVARATVRATARAAHDVGVGLIVRIGDTKIIGDLEEAFAPYGDLSVAALRDRVLLVVASERSGRRVRTDARWAPTAADLGSLGAGFLRVVRRLAPNFVRGACLADDLVVPHDLFPPARLASVAETLSTRGGRLWVSGAGSSEAGPAFGVLRRS